MTPDSSRSSTIGNLSPLTPASLRELAPAAVHPRAAAEIRARFVLAGARAAGPDGAPPPDRGATTISSSLNSVDRNRRVRERRDAARRVNSSIPCRMFCLILPAIALVVAFLTCTRHSAEAWSLLPCSAEVFIRMYRSMTLVTMTAVVMWLAPGAPAFAQRGHQGGPPPQAHAPATPHGPKTTPQPTGTEHGKSDGVGEAKGAGHGKPAGTRATTTTHTKPSFVSHIERNPALASRVKAMLPTGMTLDTAAQGFKNRGQFIAALHVSRNLDIPFDKLKAEMTGTTPKSLGQAIHALKPDVDAKTAATTAEREAKDDVKPPKAPKTNNPKSDTDRS